MFKTLILYISFFVCLFFCKLCGWDFSLFSGHPTAFCILTNKDLF